METPYLNEIEKDKIIAFNEDPVMREAVRKVLIEGIIGVGVLKEGEKWDNRNWAYNLGGLNDMAMDDAAVGNLLKVTTRALGIIEDAFEKKLLEFKRNPSEKDKKEDNPAV